MIRAVVFDCFGVLYAGTLTALAERCQTAADQASVHDLSHAVDHGFLSEDEFAEQVAPHVNLRVEEVRQLMTCPQQRLHGMFAYARELKERGVKVAVLSNFGREAIGRLFPEQETEPLFDVIVASGDIGMTKPHVSAYDYVLRRLNVRPDEAVMVDDALENVDGAIEAGMHGVVFTSLMSCRQKVEELLTHA
jgi:HAD superfamily hydrolase (TIGR01509 family)